MADEPSPAVDEVDLARSREYSLLSVLLLRSPDAQLLGQLVALAGDASPIGVAHAALAEAARRSDGERVGREYFNLFVGVAAVSCCRTHPSTSPDHCMAGLWPR